MPTQESSRLAAIHGIASSVLVGILLALLLPGVLALLLRALEPVLPLSDFPILFVLGLLVIAYLFGLGPAVVNFTASGFAYTYYFVEPFRTVWPPANTLHGWAQLTVFFLGAMLAVFGGLSMRRAKQRVEHIAAELDAKRGLLEAVTHNAPVGIGIMARDACLVMANDALAEMFGHARQSMVGERPFESLPGEAAADAQIAVDSVFSTGCMVQLREYPIALETQRYFNATFAALRSSAGDIDGVLCVLVDATDQVLTRMEIERLYNREHHIAECLQAGLIGTAPERLDQFQFETLYHAALDEARVGGDFYDVFRIGPGRIGIVVGDVSGKGLQAAVEVVTAKYSIRAGAQNEESPAMVLERANQAMYRDMGPESFVSAFVGVIDSASDTLTYASAGHAPAIRWDGSTRSPSMLDSTGPLLGIEEIASYGEETLALRGEDELLVGTDGLYEVRCESGFLEIEGLLCLYTEMRDSGEFTIPQLVRRLMDFCGGDLRDDLAIIRVTNTASDPS